MVGITKRSEMWYSFSLRYYC